MRLDSSALLSASMVFYAATSNAQSPGDASIDREYRHGIERFITRGLGAEGQAYFQRLWDRTHEPRMLWQVAVSESLMGRWRDAERHMGQVLHFVDHPWVRAQRGGTDGLDEDRRRAQGHLGQVQVICTPSCTEVTVNDEHGVTGRIYVEPGTVRILANRDGSSPVARSVVVAAGAMQSVRIVFDDERNPSVSAPTERRAHGAEDAEGRPAPPEPATTTTFPRFVLDAGAGIGLAFLSGRPQYAERFDYTSGSTTGYTCSNYVCYTTIDPGWGPTYWLSLNVRFNVNHRIGIGAASRFQFDAGDWTTSAIINDGSRRVQLTRSNPFANLLLALRVYVALGREGFTRQGSAHALYIGLGGGQIEPKPALSSSVMQPGAHVVSGYGNVHVGYRVEYAWRGGFHLAGEITAHFMFPIFLFDMDFAALVGFHI